MLPWASGVRTNVAAPPLASVPWQLAHCSDLALSYAGIEALAKSVAPRSTARLSKPSFSWACRFGSSSQYSGSTTATMVENTSAHRSTRVRCVSSMTSSS